MACKISVFIVCMCSIFFISCFNDTSEKLISLPETHFISDELLWATIILPYTAFFDIPGAQGIVLSHGRKGDVLQITGRMYAKENTKTTLWLQCEKGWLSETAVNTYKNELQAQKASSQL